MESKRASSRPLHGESKRLRLEHYPTPHATYGVPMSLNLDCKIFLSHSGKDKEFVRFLYDALCRRYHAKEVAFFDEETLPKAEAISMENILMEAKKSQLGVLVLTEDFFVHTPNPMLELEAFEAGKVKLLPLFFGMGVEEFKKKRRTRSWEKQWRKWTTKQLGGRSNVEVLEMWRRSLELVTIFSGLEYKKIATSHIKYIDKIVDEVTHIVPNPVLFSEKGVCGKNRLCQMVNSMYEKCAEKHSSLIDRTLSEVASTSASFGRREEHSGCAILDLVGIHGFSGLGKTTLCKCLCDFYFSKFNGNVCHIDIGSLLHQKHLVSSRMQYVISSLSTCDNNDFLHFQDIDQVRNLFNKRLSSMTDPIFLAIDNILPDRECEVEADFYLSCEFPKGSRIFITSRSESVLRNLVIQHNSNFSIIIEYMPAIEFEEARDIFVCEFPALRKFGFSNLEDDVNECVRMCTILEMVYHPMMLKSLAAFVRWDRSIESLDWKGRLAKLRSEGIIHKENAWETVFNLFDKAYGLLTWKAQQVFLELALFYDATHYNSQMHEWIKMLYPHLCNKKMDEILQLQDLCFLQKKECCIEILDLLVDYGKYKAGQGVHPEYVVMDDVHRWDDLPRSARTVSISRWGHDMKRRSTLDLRDVEGVKVLHIVDNSGLQEVLLSNTTCAHLRSLIIRVPVGMLLFCTYDGDWSTMSAYTGGCLQWVELEGDVCFRSAQFSERRIPMLPGHAIPGSLKDLEISSSQVAADLVSVLGGFRNLEVLKLSKLPGVRSIDVMTCAHLRVLDLFNMLELEFISGFENPNLENVSIDSCDKVSALIIPADSETLFFICKCQSLERISFCMTPSFCAGAHSSSGPGLFLIDECPAVTNVDGLSQYEGCFSFEGGGMCREGIWEERFGDLLKLDDGVDYSICKAEIKQLVLTGYNPTGLASAKEIDLEKAQHIGLFISALFKAQPKDLQQLSIWCKEEDCGCDQIVPHFGPLPRPNSDEGPVFQYFCPQVKELASLVQWHVVKHLDLNGCTNVEVWPDFAAMTSLERLYLGYTSLKEWPAGVLHLPHLESLDMRGCQQLPAEELMKVVTFELQPVTPGIAVCVISSLANLQDDLKSKRKDRCSVADALDGVYAELIDLFDRSSCWSLYEVLVVELVVAIMYDVWWFGEVDAAQELDIREKMRRLLCSKSFLSLPFSACSPSLLLPAASLPQLTISVRDLYNMAGGEQETEAKHLATRVMGLMGIALVGEGSVTWFDAPLNDGLKESIIDFLEGFTLLEAPYDTLKTLMPHSPTSTRWPELLELYPLEEEEGRALRKRVGEAVCRVARVGSMAAELGEAVVHTISQGLEADSSDYYSLDEAASSDYCTDEAASSKYYSSDEAASHESG